MTVEVNARPYVSRRTDAQERTAVLAVMLASLAPETPVAVDCEAVDELEFSSQRDDGVLLARRLGTLSVLAAEALDGRVETG